MLKNNLSKYLTFTLLIILILNFSCTTKYRKAKNALPDEDKNFISSVRYLITGKERKIFVYLGQKERTEFIAEFWKKRDPTPESEENEYKDTYYQRMKEANDLFVSSGKNGWLSDRGRTYILFGPPERRDKYPMGYSFYEPPIEVWYYGMFPIIFIDQHRDGTYKINYRDYTYLQQITQAEMILHPKYKIWNKSLIAKIKIEKSETGKQTVQADIPYKAIVFHKKKDKYIGVLILELEIFNKNEETKTIKKNVEIVLTKKELNKLPVNYKLKEQVDVSPGTYKIELKIMDKTTGKGLTRTFNLIDK